MKLLYMPIQFQVCVQEWHWSSKRNYWRTLTAHHHHGHREDFLAICGRSDVTKANGGQTGHCEVEWWYVEGVLTGSSLPLAWSAGIVAIRCTYTGCQLIEPAVCLNGVGDFINDLIITDAVPDTGQPVCHQTKDAHKENQNSSTILQIVVQFASYAAQTQQTHHFKRAEKAAETL